MNNPTESPNAGGDAPAEANPMDMGVQPLDALMNGRGVSNHDLVAAAAGTGLTHKVVQKARKGRQLTARAQKKVLAACNAAFKTRELPPVEMADLFNYKGR